MSYVRYRHRCIPTESELCAAASVVWVHAVAMPVTMKTISPTKVLAAPSGNQPPYLVGTKTPPPNRRTPYHLDDPQYDADRVPQFQELQTYEMTLTQSKAAAEVAARKEADALFKARQESRLVLEKSEKDRAKSLRKNALEKMRWETEGFQTKEPGYDAGDAPGPGPGRRWTWTVASKHPRQMSGAHDVLVPPQPPMYNGADVTVDAFYKYAQGIQSHEDDMKSRGHVRRIAEDDAIQSVEDRKKFEREAEAKAQQQAMTAKAAAAERAATARARAIKKEMAEEKKKQRAVEEKKQATKWKDSIAQRQANMTYAKEHGHWDWGIKRQPDLMPPKALAEKAE